MKQIFDWLREAICEGSKCINERYYTTVVHSLSCVNEAEAKWETECCEWRKTKWFEDYICYHNDEKFFIEQYMGKDFKYCPICGKPIKISEVE